MALSGSFTGTIRRGYSIRVDWSATQNYSSNSSTVTCNLYFINDYAINIGARNNSITISGQKFTLRSNAITTVGTHYIGKATKTIAHNSDGTSPTISMSAVFNIAATLSGVYYENINASGTAVFNTIPRTSQVSLSYASPAIIGKTLITIKTNRKSTSFTHNIAYEFEGKVGEVIATSVGDSVTWTPPDGFYSYITDKFSGNCIITCNTYSSGVKIGSSTASLNIQADRDKYKPTVESWNVTEGDEAVKKIGLSADEFIDKISTIKVSVTGLTTYKGASFSNLAFGVGDVTVESKDKTGVTVVKPTTNVSGNVECGIIIVDSRGIFNYYTKNIKIYTYNLPIDKSTVKRLNNYEAQTTITPSVEISTFGGKHGALTYKYRYYEKNGSPGEYLSFENLVSSNGKVTGKSVELNLDNTKEWLVDLQFSDGLNTVNRTETVSRGVPMFFMNSDNGDLEVYGNIYSQGNIVPTIIESGTSGIWRYRKYSDGTAECWGTAEFTVKFQSGGTSVYYTNGEAVFPFKFISMPIVNGSCPWNYVNWVNAFGSVSDFGKCEWLYYQTNKNGDGSKRRVYLHAIGQWK